MAYKLVRISDDLSILAGVRATIHHPSLKLWMGKRARFNSHKLWKSQTLDPDQKTSGLTALGKDDPKLDHPTRSRGMRHFTHTPLRPFLGRTYSRRPQSCGGPPGQAGVCVLSQSRSAASMRVCQPAPVARNAANTSWLYRTATCSLTG